MDSKKRQDRGEWVLLSVFAIFIIAYLIDIKDLPMEGTILSYILAPFIFILLILCFVHTIISAKKSGSLENAEKDGASAPGSEDTGTPPREELQKRKDEGKRVFITMGMGFFLLLAIFLAGFYIGSGLMLLAWFLAFKRVNITTLAIMVATPLIFYIMFEVLIDFGLYEGLIIEYLRG